MSSYKIRQDAKALKERAELKLSDENLKLEIVQEMNYVLKMLDTRERCMEDLKEMIILKTNKYNDYILKRAVDKMDPKAKASLGAMLSILSDSETNIDYMNMFDKKDKGGML